MLTVELFHVQHHCLSRKIKGTHEQSSSDGEFSIRCFNRNPLIGENSEMNNADCKIRTVSNTVSRDQVDLLQQRGKESGHCWLFLSIP